MCRERPVWGGSVRVEGKPVPRRAGQRCQAEGTHLMQSPECDQCQNKIYIYNLDRREGIRNAQMVKKRLQKELSRITHPEVDGCMILTKAGVA